MKMLVKFVINVSDRVILLRQFKVFFSCFIGVELYLIP